MVKVISGTAYVSIVNVNRTATKLQPRCSLGILHQTQIVSLPSGISEVPVEPCGSRVATVNSQAGQIDPVCEFIQAVDLQAFSKPEQLKVRDLLYKYSSIF